MDTEAQEGALDFQVPLKVFSASGDTNCWALAGSGVVKINNSLTADKVSNVIRKTGAAKVQMAYAACEYRAEWHVVEGEVAASNTGLLGGKRIVVGGEETAARVTFTGNRSAAGGVEVLAYTNGYANISDGMEGGRISLLGVFNGGSARCGYMYLGRYQLSGGTITGTDWSEAIANYPEGVTTYASDTTSLYKMNFRLNWWDPNPFTIANGEAPVDFEITTISGTDNSTGSAAGNHFAKNGPGVMRVTGNCSGLTRWLWINAGTWLADNADNGCSRGRVFVAAGATLGGTGGFGSADVFEEAYVTVNGADGNPGRLAPGSIDATTGEHVLGTLRIGEASVSNKVLLNAHAQVRTCFGIESCDRLDVVGKLEINGTGTSLEIVPLPEDVLDVKGGTYTIVTATEGITGEFASIVAPKGWKVSKVNARSVTVGEGEEARTVEVYDALTVSMAGRGLTIIVR